MNSPYTAPRLLLVADNRSTPADPGGVAIRRFRIARVRYDARGIERRPASAWRASSEG